MNADSFHAPAAPFWRRWTPLFVAGLTGVAAIAPSIPAMIDNAMRRAPNAPTVGRGVALAASLAQTSLLLAGAVAAGVAIAPRLGFRSHLVERFGLGETVKPSLQTEAPLALTIGAVGAAAIVALDHALARVSSVAILSAGQDLTSATRIDGILTRLLYGGITEELLMRWGLMSALAWLGWRLFQRGRGAVTPAIVLGANVVTALLFGAGHLPAVATIMTLTPPIVVQVITLNALIGVGLGWLYARRSLEAAMLAHATAHVVFILAAAAGLLG